LTLHTYSSTSQQPEPLVVQPQSEPGSSATIRALLSSEDEMETSERVCVCLNYNNNSITTVHYCSSRTQQLPSSQQAQSIPSHSGQIINIRQSRSVSWIYCKLNFDTHCCPPSMIGYTGPSLTHPVLIVYIFTTDKMCSIKLSKHYPETTKVSLLTPIYCVNVYIT